MLIKTQARQTGKQNQQLVKTSLLPFWGAFSVGLLALMILWHLHPDIFGTFGENLYPMLTYIPLTIAGVIVGGLMVSWVMVSIYEYDADISSENIKKHYSTGLFCVLIMAVVLLLALFWLYFNGVTYYHHVVGKIQLENLNHLLAFDRMPVVITGQILLGFLVLRQFFATLQDGLFRHGWHLLIGFCVLAVILTVQFFYLGLAQGNVVPKALLGDVMMIVMFLYGGLTGLIVLGGMFCLVRMKTGHYQAGTDFSVVLLRECWGGLFLLWGLSIIGIIIWRPALV